MGRPLVLRINQQWDKVVFLEKEYCTFVFNTDGHKKAIHTSIVWSTHGQWGKCYALAIVKSTWVVTPTMWSITQLLKIASLKELKTVLTLSYTQPMSALVWQLMLETVGYNS